MGHHIAGMSNAAKRRAALAEERDGTNDASAGILSAVQSRFADLCSVGKAKAVEMEHAVEEQIQHRPIMSVIAALVVGALVGAVCTRACRRE